MIKEDKHKEMLAALNKYLTETPKDIIKADMDRISAMNFPGPTAEEYFKRLGNMNGIEAPFTQEQVDSINKYQQRRDRHPFTCCSPKEIKECQRISGDNEGILIAEVDGLKCPCGKYTQDWVDEYMVK